MTDKKVWFITGAGRGMGVDIAGAALAAGNAVVATGRNPEAVAKAVGEADDLLVVALDITKPEQAEAAVRTAVDRFGSIDVLVNSAGVGVGGNVEQLTTKKWDLQFAVNLRGAFVVTRESIPKLKESRGLVVNLASIAGTVPVPGLAGYAASKAALISLTKSMNRELEDDGVRLCALCPGFVDTPMASWTGMSAQEMIHPDDCAEVVRMLLKLSPAARIPQVVIERMGETP